MHIAFITVGNPARLTGGYLYHARVFALLQARGMQITQIVAAGAEQTEQQAQAAVFGAAFDPQGYDAVVVDALAVAVCGPHLAAWQAQRPLIAMVHELPNIAAGRGIGSDEAALLQADVVVAVSRHGIGLLAAHGVAPERIRIVSPGRDRLSTVPVPRQPNRQPVVLCVAQWIERKGIATLVKAWQRRSKQIGLLRLIGDTDADTSYTQQIRALAEGDQSVEIVGVVSDLALAAAYQTADCFALPSRYEGYGTVYAEALEYGLPVIACAIGPIPELVGDAGLLVPANDQAALAAALDTLLTDTALRETLANAARARAAMLPTWGETAAGFAAAITAALAR